MKNILSGAVAAIALVAISAPAAAQNAQAHYANTWEGTFQNSSDIGKNASATLSAALGIGTAYYSLANAPDDTETATRTVNVNFRLKGTVNKDCSFYSGNTDSARSIDFGVIGVRTGNNENVNKAFTMRGAASAVIESLTAGCNTENEVVITKDSSDGLVNHNPGSYDSGEFTANIPYSVYARWNGVPYGAGASNGVSQNINLTVGELTKVKQQGAWRSDMTILINAPAVSGKGLVAGQYKGTTTLTLRAL